MDYINLAEIYQDLEKTSKRLEKTYILSKFMKQISKVSEVEPIINLLRGSVFPSWDEHKIGVSEKLVIKALAISSGNPEEKIEKLWVKLGDLGEAAFNLIKNKKQTTLQTKVLTINDVYNNLRNLAELEGSGTVNKKMALISELLTSATPLEAKFITRTILEDLRTGVGESTLRDAIVWHFFGVKLKLDYNPETNTLNLKDEYKQEYNLYAEKVQAGYDLTNDFAEVFKSIMESGISGVENVSLKPGKPMNVMLAIKANSEKEAIDALDVPVLCDYKLDGFRVQIHKTNNKVSLFTRRLENVTRQFEELLPIINDHVLAKNFILDAEVVGYDPKTSKYLPFQNISQRIKRKYDIAEIAKKIPVEINVFDIMYKDGKSLINFTQKDRHIILEKTIKELKHKIVIPKFKLVYNENDIHKFYEQSLQAGNEGLMVKSLTQTYVSGRKVGGWVKLKPVLETLDLVITRAEWGTGKRANWLSSFTVACLSSDGSSYLEVGKVGTGIKEKSAQPIGSTETEHTESARKEGEIKVNSKGESDESKSVTFEELTELLKPLMIDKSSKEIRVKPEIVVELKYEEIQASEEYSSGFALRFPRIVRLRNEKSVKDINTLEDVKHIYNTQKGREKK